MLEVAAAISIASKAFTGLKAAVAAGREIQDVMGQLSEWAGAIADIDKRDELNKKKKTSIFKSLLPTDGKSIEAEAMEIYTARIAARNQRSELMEILGVTQGDRGKREFLELEKKIRADRKRLVHAEIERREKLKDFIMGSIVVVLSVCTVVGIFWLVIAIIQARQ